MPTEPWEVAIVATLRRHLVQGCSFENAWRLALKECRPSQRDRLRVAQDVQAVMPDLFHQDQVAELEPSVVECMRSYCEDAYFGRKPELSGFSLDSLRETIDERSGLAVMSDYRTAA